MTERTAKVMTLKRLLTPNVHFRSKVKDIITRGGIPTILYTVPVSAQFGWGHAQTVTGCFCVMLDATAEGLYEKLWKKMLACEEKHGNARLAAMNTETWPNVRIAWLSWGTI